MGEGGCKKICQKEKILQGNTTERFTERSFYRTCFVKENVSDGLQEWLRHWRVQFNNMEIIQGIMTAVREEKAPVILQISKGAREYASISYLRAIIDVAVKENPDIPVCMHLDHGDTFELCKQCVDDGYTSVMVDGLPFFF